MYTFSFIGGRIDHGHHGNKAHKALTETIAFSEAVEKAMSMTDIEDTLIIVTADHSHVFTMSGYASPENDILGIKNMSIGGTPIVKYFKPVQARQSGIYLLGGFHHIDF